MDTKTLCLGVLTLGELSGYDIRKHLEETFSNFMEISPNGVYPALKALEKEGMVTFRTAKEGKYPSKKIYKLTTQGRSFFTDALQVLPPRHKVRSQLLLLIFFAEMLPASRMAEIMKERLGELDYWSKVCIDWRSSPESKKAGVGSHFLVDYSMSVMDAEINFIKKNAQKLVKKLKK